MIIKNTVNRVLERRLPSQDERRLLLLTGARQTGKTTLLRGLYPALRYVNFDDLANREWCSELPAVHWGRDMGMAILDEVQKESRVFEKVKYAYDDGQISFSALSGSAQVLLIKKIRESLAGRIFIYELWPLMFCEIVSALRNNAPVPLLATLLDSENMSDTLDLLPSILPPPEQALLDDVLGYMLHWGGMPELLRLDDAQRLEWLRSYTITYLERDLGDLARLSDLLPFKKFQQLVALRSARMLSFSEIARDAGISPSTAQRYIEYLKISYQAFLLHPYQNNLTSRLVKMPKAYMADVGILRSLSGQHTVCTGEIFETFVVGEIMKYLRTSGSLAGLSYYRTRSGLEVDLMLETSRGVMAFEIKSSENIGASAAGGLRRIAETLGNHWLGGAVLYCGKKLYHLRNPNIWAIPVSRFFA